jgi:23S rRNA (adenine2503-C2)-methyltransferase
VSEVFQAAQGYADKTGRRVSIEYALIRDANDQGWRADMLGKKLHKHLGQYAHVNLIPLNPTPGSEWGRVPEAGAGRVRAAGEGAGYGVHRRDTRGQEIAVACDNSPPKAEPELRAFSLPWASFWLPWAGS